MIACWHFVKFLRTVDDDARENVESTGGAFRVGRSRDLRRQAQAFQQGNDIDTAGFKHRAFGQIDFMQLETLKLVDNGGSRPRHETGTDAIGFRTKPQVKARRLDLVTIKIALCPERAGLMQSPDAAVRQNTRLMSTHVDRQNLTKTYKSFSVSPG